MSKKTPAEQSNNAPADALLSERFINGRQIGLRGEPAHLVPGQPGTPDHDEAMRGWKSAQRDLAYQDAMWSMA